MSHGFACLAIAAAFLPAMLATRGVRADAPDHVAAPRDPAGIYGGQLAATCEWPSAVGLLGAQTQCTGSLVHPEIVVTAGHCLEGGALTTATFGEDVYAPHSQVGIAYCEQHPNYPLDYPDYADFMYCKLAQPVMQVPIVPIAMGCEVDEIVPGASAVLAGYGLADDGGLDGLKREVTTSIDFVEGTRVFFVGGTGKGTCSGDSGGPSYVQLHDGTWRVFGTTTGGSECGDWGQSELVHRFVPWIEEHSGIDVTPCHDADGTWAPTATCAGFTASLGGGDWSTMCGGAAVMDPSETCGPAFGDDAGESTGGDEPEPDEPEETSEGSSGGEDTGVLDDDPEPLPTTTATFPVGGADRDPSGCACDVSRGRDGIAASVVLLVLAQRRRRRTNASGSSTSGASER